MKSGDSGLCRKHSGLKLSKPASGALCDINTDTGCLSWPLKDAFLQHSLRVQTETSLHNLDLILAIRSFYFFIW